MANEASRPDLDFMAPEYALRGNDADIIQVTKKLYMEKPFPNYLKYYLITITNIQFSK